MDSELATAVSRWNSEQMRKKRALMATAVQTVARGDRVRRRPTPPPGWESGVDATRASLLAAQSLGVRGRKS